MLKSKIISPEELVKFGSAENLNEQALSLIQQQKATWETVARNFNGLNHIQTREFSFGYFKIKVQFNPERIRSSAAKTDAKSIASRPCFLCLKNLPPEQKGILFQNKYVILANPFPIFQKHLTISSLEHVPQKILPYFPDMLELCKNFTGFTVFYNGPGCGASAPDHLHFQAGNLGFLPLDNEFETVESNFSDILFQNKNSKIIASKEYLRRFVAIVSTDKNLVLEKFGVIHNQLNGQPGNEPKMNVLCNFTGGKWRVVIFPRNIQHPSHFYRTDEKRIVVGPAAVELGGVLVLPREEDFKKITKKEIAEIYDEVTIDKENFEKLKKTLDK